MGPRQKCLGNWTARFWRQYELRCFNGAETKMSRKWIFGLNYRNTHAGFNGAETKMSRKFVDMSPEIKQQQIASMGPRQKCLGNYDSLHNAINLLFASMGPRQKCLGNAAKIPTPTKTDILALQWGRDKNVSEIALMALYGKSQAGLQWGRDKNVSEIFSRADSLLCIPSFNGAETKMSRKSVRRDFNGCSRHGFNGAETKMSRKWYCPPY